MQIRNSDYKLRLILQIQNSPPFTPVGNKKVKIAVNILGFPTSKTIISVTWVTVSERPFLFARF